MRKVFIYGLSALVAASLTAFQLPAKAVTTNDNMPPQQGMDSGGAADATATDNMGQSTTTTQKKEVREAPTGGDNQEMTNTQTNTTKTTTKMNKKSNKQSGSTGGASSVTTKKTTKKGTSSKK